MTTESGTPAGDIAAPADTSELSINEARDMLFAELDKEQTADDADLDSPSEFNRKARAEQAKRHSDDPESSKEDSAPETDPAEDAEDAKPEDDLPPIEPPRSWTKAEKDRFNSLPRETQEYLHTREQERERDFRRSQNEIAEERKAAKAEREKAEHVRRQYEDQLPALMREMQNAQQESFSDIRTMDDVAKLQSEDPFRFQAWQVQQMKLQAVNSELQKAESEKAALKQTQRATYEQEQTARLIELLPEMSDPKKANELRTRAVSMLTDDLELKTEQLTRWMQDDIGHEILSNAGIQKLIADGLKLRDIQNAPKAIAAKPVPHVQRPGVARPVGAADSEKIQALEARLNQTGSIKDAEALLFARMNASNRRAS